MKWFRLRVRAPLIVAAPLGRFFWSTSAKDDNPRVGAALRSRLKARQSHEPASQFGRRIAAALAGRPREGSLNGARAPLLGTICLGPSVVGGRRGRWKPAMRNQNWCS
jgi:hypothetical protein